MGVVGAVVVAAAVIGHLAAQTTPRLVTPTTLVKLGSFTLPADAEGRGFEYGGTALAYHAANDSLFIVGHDWDQFMAELTIPALGGTAAIIQALRDPAEGRSVGEADAKVGGALVHDGRLWFTKYIYYDGDASQTASHFNRPLALATTGQVVGPLTIGSLPAGFVSGYLGRIPEEWQARLGGTVLTGNCCLSVISRTSYGPAASAWTPGQTTAIPLVHYTGDHQTLGTYGAPGVHPTFNGTTRIKGVVFPEGTDSVLFFGRTGTGPYCYGEADACGDPSNDYRGEHAYPYHLYVWAYNAYDLAAVRTGAKQPWQVEPYQVWDLGIAGTSEFTSHAAYDPYTARIFVSEVNGNGDLPLIHVFTAGLSLPVVTWPPPASIAAGTPLGPAQLNASANVPGAFVYAPPTGTVLAPGPHTLTATFTPTDGAHYTAATRSVTIEVRASAPVFTDDPLLVGTTPVKAAHITELRAAIDSLRTRHGLAAPTWTDPVLAAGATPVRVEHLTELRAALDTVYVAAKRTPPTYQPPTVVRGVTVIAAAHVAELRAAVLAIW